MVGNEFPMEIQTSPLEVPRAHVVQGVRVGVAAGGVALVLGSVQGPRVTVVLPPDGVVALIQGLSAALGGQVGT